MYVPKSTQTNYLKFVGISYHIHYIPTLIIDDIVDIDSHYCRDIIFNIVNVIIIC